MVRVFAYCAASYAGATAKAAGVRPLTSPPLTADGFDPAWLAGYDLLYLALHGNPGEFCLYGDNYEVALRAEQVRQARLGGAGVFAASCFMGDAASPMRAAFLAAGAAWVLAGAGPNFSGYTTPAGAALLGLWVRRLLTWHVPLPQAVRLAKERLLLDLPREVRGEVRDTLGFRLWRA